MPVGCFPSFRKKIKKFNKGKAPLPKKEEPNNDNLQNNVKPTEANNHVEEKVETPIKVEDRSHEESAPIQPTEETVQQQQQHLEEASMPAEISHDNFETVESPIKVEEHHGEESAPVQATEEALEQQQHLEEASKPEEVSHVNFETVEESNIHMENEVESPIKVEEHHNEESAPIQATEETIEQQQQHLEEASKPAEVSHDNFETVEESNVHTENEVESPIKVEEHHNEESAPIQAPEETVEQQYQHLEEASKPAEVFHDNFEPNQPVEYTASEAIMMSETAQYTEAEPEVHCQADSAGGTLLEHAEVEETAVPHENEHPCESVPQTETVTEHLEMHESDIPQESLVQCETVAHNEAAMVPLEVNESYVPQEIEQQCESAVVEESHTQVEEYTAAQEAQLPCEPIAMIEEHHADEQELSHPQENEIPCEQISSETQEHEAPVKSEEEHVEGQQPTEPEPEGVLPRGFHWKLVSSPLPEGAIDIHELHLPIHVGLVETCHGEIPCKYLEKNRTFYAGIDGREENFAYGKILCLDPNMAGSIELEWVHVNTPDIRSRNLVAGTCDANGKLMYIARGMIPLTGPYPYYELSSGWVSEDLEEANLAFGGVEWHQRDFDVLAWKPRCN